MECRSDVHTCFLAIVAKLRRSCGAVGSTMADLVAKAAVASELTSNSRVGAFSLGMTLLTAVEAGARLCWLRALSLIVTTQIISRRTRGEEINVIMLIVLTLLDRN
jgi:hypothetical protein